MKNKYKAIALDDEKLCLDAVDIYCRKYKPEVEIIGSFRNASTALEKVESLNPDIIFVDIDMPEMNGMEFVNALPPSVYQVIFTTAYDEFALQAFRLSVCDYLLKPLAPESFIQACNKAIQNIILAKNQSFEKEIKLFLQSSQRTLSIPTSDGMEFIPIQDILFCKAENSYCHLGIINAKSKLVSRSLKDMESALPTTDFLRVHHSYLININHLRSYHRSDGGYLTLTNEHKIPISRNKKDSVKEFM